MDEIKHLLDGDESPKNAGETPAEDVASEEAPVESNTEVVTESNS